MIRAALIVLALGLGAAQPAAAQVYRWVDPQGVPHYSQGSNSVPEQYRGSAQPVEMPSTPTSTTEPTESKPGVRGGATVHFKPGGRIMVDVRINGRASARLQLDTGADGTVINPRALVAAGASLTEGTTVGLMRGVTGQEQVRGVIIDSLEVGEAKVGRMRVMSFDIGFGDSDGLLGRDFLNQFHLSIDSTRGVVTLTPK